MNHLIRQIFITIGILASMSQVQAAVTVYVPLGSANEILIIDGDEDRVIGNIADVNNTHGLATTSAGDYLVANSMELAPKKQPIPEGMTEDEHAAHHVGTKGQNSETSNGASFVSLIDTKTKRVLQRIEVDGITHHSVITPDGRYAISTHTTAGNVSIIDLVNRNLIKTITTGPVPNYVLASADGKFIYVSNSGNNTISEIETRLWTIRRTIGVGATPEHMVFSADEQTLYVINVGGNNVTAISLIQAKPTNTYQVGAGPHGIDISDNGKFLFVSNKNGDSLSVIDLASGKTRNKVLGPNPYHIASIKGTGKLYVSSRSQPWIWVLDQKSLEVTGKIQIKGEGHQMGIVRR